MNKPDLSIVIPCLNEEENLDALFEKIKNSLHGNCNFEVLLIDDNSSDNTFEKSIHLAKVYSKYYSTKVILRDPQVQK